MEHANKAPIEARQANGWLQQVAAARWFERRALRHRIEQKGTDEPVPKKSFRDVLCRLLGREIGPEDPAYEWNLMEAEWVAEHFMTALVSGCVPLPRTQPLPLNELPGHLGYDLALPHGTTWPEAPAE